MSEQLKTDELLTLSAYDGSKECDTLFLEALQEELCFHYDSNAMFRQFCDRKGFDPHNEIKSLEDIPPVAVSVFKNLGFQLASVPKEELSLTLQSSATSGVPSTVQLDKITSKRQAKAMVKVVSAFIGNERKPFLIMDIDPRSADRKLLGARFAAVTGYLKFANRTGYFLKAKDGVSYFDVGGILQFVDELPHNQPVVVFGFTYILYQNVLKTIQQSGLKIQLPKGSKIIHIGGWKKLESEKVEKSLFNQQLADGFGIEPTDVIDIYGFTEQMGINYPDCECGCKHASSYVRVIARDSVTREVVSAGKEGMMEFITPVPHSYPGNAVLTDDMGVIESEPCPYGRPGIRFRITGRMKKAEVRGCGDILSNKLTFQKSGTDSVADNNLEIQLYKGRLSEGLTPSETLHSITDSLRDSHKWLREQPVEALIGIIGEASKVWMSDSRYAPLKDKGLLFLSSWCSAEHLNRVAEFGLRGCRSYADRFLPFPSSDRHLLKANPRGLVCHWLAGNVQILGLFALVQSIMTKNVNLLRVSAKDEGVFKGLLSAFEGLAYTTSDGYLIKGDDILRTLAVVYFPHSAYSLGELMSEEADVRIAWGGRDAVEAVAGFPSRYDSETVIFGPKLSFAVIGREKLDDAQDVRKLARRVAVDVCVFDQTGCASPHNLFIECGGRISPEEFCTILDEAMRKVEFQIPKPAMTSEQISAAHNIRGVYDFKGKVFGSQSLSYTVLFNDTVELDAPVYGRVLFVHAVDDIKETLPFVNENIQTIGVALDDERACRFASEATVRGASRLPQIGRMLNFEMPWDGIVLIDRLVKWNTLMGPLC